MEELMGLYGGLNAPGADDPRRRRGLAGRGEGTVGADQAAGMMAQYFGGRAGPGYSGPMAGRGGAGLAGLLEQVMAHGGEGFSGPAQRHFANQGFDFMPPGLDNQNPVGGPNVAPGNIDTGRAVDQPMGNQTPGVPRGVAMGQQPGRVAPYPQTQGWRNVAPGGAIAASLGYGTPEFGGHFAAGTALPPGAMGGGGPERAATGGGGGGGTAGGAGGGGRVAASGEQVGGGTPAAGGGTPTQGGGGGGGSKPAKAGGGKPGPAKTPGLSTRPGSAGPGMPGNATEANQAKATMAGAKSEAKVKRQAAKAKAIKQAANKGVTGPKAGSGIFYDTISTGPKAGQGGKGISGGPAPAPPPASSFGKDERGTGTEPIKGKTKPKKTSTSAQQR